MQGGALRDIFLGGTIKDFDIFMNSTAPSFPDFIPTPDYISNPESAIDDKSVVSQGTYHYLGDPTLFNIIRCTADVAPLARFDKFDFGICKVAFATSSGFISEFLYDVKHQQMTLTRANSANGILQSLLRYKRFKVKYPWPLVIQILLLTL